MSNIDRETIHERVGRASGVLNGVLKNDDLFQSILRDDIYLNENEILRLSCLFATVGRYLLSFHEYYHDELSGRTRSQKGRNP